MCFGFFDDLTTSEKLGDASRRIELAFVWSHRVNSMIERFDASIVGIERQRRDAICPQAQLFCLYDSPAAERRHILRTIEKRESLL